MMKNNISLLISLLVMLLASGCQDERLKALIVTGQNNHNWQESHLILKQILENSGRFDVDVAVSPEKDGDMSVFNPDFSSYDVVVLDYNGDDWSEKTRQSFESFVSGGGGLVIYHAASNSFPNWEAFNKMAGVGGWNGRSEKSGPYVYYQMDSLVYDTTPGRGGSHGPQHEFIVTHRQPDHPILQGLPEKWIQSLDELYSELRGPAENMEVLATAYADPNKKGTGRHEPMLMTIKYGKGRVFHTAMGHVGKERPLAAQSAGFIVTLQRGAEWAASGVVTQVLPPDMSNVAMPLVLSEYRFYSFDELLQKASRFEYGQSSLYPTLITGRLRNAAGDAAFLAKAEKSIAAFLPGDASADAKNYLCRELSWMGSDASVPALKELLKNPETKEMAQYAIDRIQSSPK